MMKHNKQALKNTSFLRVCQLAQDAQVPLAIVRWNKYMAQYEDCTCESQMFDQKRCGFCFLSRLQRAGLTEPKRHEAKPFMDAAHFVSTFLMVRHSPVPPFGNFPLCRPPL